MKAKTGKNYFGAARVKDGLGVHMWRSLVEQQGGSVLNEDRHAGHRSTPRRPVRRCLHGPGLLEVRRPRHRPYDAASRPSCPGETACS
jgi:hypothetical protein